MLGLKSLCVFINVLFLNVSIVRVYARFEVFMRFYKRFVFNVTIVRVVTRLSFYNKVYARFEVFMRFYECFVFNVSIVRV